MSHIYSRVKDTIFAMDEDVSGNLFAVGFFNGYVYSVYPGGYCYKLLDSNRFVDLDSAKDYISIHGLR